MEDTDHNKLGTRIRELRTARNLTHESLAERAGISFHSVSAAERGVRGGHLETVIAIAHALDLSVSELLFGVDRSPPPELASLTTALAGQSIEVQRAILKLVTDALALATAARGDAATATPTRSEH